MSNVWTYWRCTSCKNIIRGDNKTCPCCGAAIPNGVKYMMPDNPEVISAMDRGEIITGKENYEKEINSAGIVEEIVPEELESNKPNWNCIYCGYQNAYENTSCVNCGAGKEEAEEDYFGNKPTFDEENKKEFETRKGYSYDDFIKEIEEPSTVDFPNEDGGETEPEPEPKESFLTKAKDGISDFLHSDVFPLAAKITAGVLALIFLIWLFFPITRVGKVTGFEWDRTIEVEEFTLCHEEDWSVPAGGRITSQEQRLHHTDHVIDHYETKTRQVAYQVLDHYDTHVYYSDNGNGQATKHETHTPVYRTEYRTETYQDPVYKDVPVYKTYYHYDIDRWKHHSDLRTSGSDRNPYWKETTIPEDVSNPDYGDKRLGDRTEHYFAVIVDDREDIRSAPVSYSEWMDLEIGQEIEYKTFRFSHRPLGGY